jgi:hypothetical protein
LEVFSTKLSASISILGGISRFGFLDVSSRWFVTGFLRILNMNDIWVWVNTYRYIFSGLFTSINPSYFDVNRRGTIGFDTLPCDLSRKFGLKSWLDVMHTTGLSMVIQGQGQPDCPRDNQRPENVDVQMLPKEFFNGLV